MATISVLNTDTQLSGKTVITAEGDWTITGQWSFNRSPSAPFVVQAGSAKVSNLDADKLDGSDWASVGTDIIPDGDRTRNLGSASFRWIIAGVTNPNAIADGRLTATTAVPVTTADVSGVTSVFYTPYIGNRIALYDGSSLWNVRTFTEITISLVGLTASKPYDIFAYDNAGTVTIETLVWTNTTTRATALTYQDGVLVKTGATTRRYLGTVYINASGGQTDDTLVKRYIFNYYNRVLRPLRRIETTATWTYNSGTIRQANGSTSNQVEVMVGVSEDVVSVSLNGWVSGTVGDFPQASFGLDSITVFSTVVVQPGVRLGSANGISYSASYSGFPGVGYHYLAWLEARSGAATVTFSGTNGGADTAGISGSCRA